MFELGAATCQRMISCMQLGGPRRDSRSDHVHRHCRTDTANGQSGSAVITVAASLVREHGERSRRHFLIVWLSAASSSCANFCIALKLAYLDCVKVPSYVLVVSPQFRWLGRDN